MDTRTPPLLPRDRQQPSQGTPLGAGKWVEMQVALLSDISQTQSSDACSPGQAGS